MEPLKIACQMQPATRRADGSVTIKLVTKEEVETDLFALIDSYRQVNGWLLFGPDKQKDSEIPSSNAVEKEMTPSQYLRQALYVLWGKKGGDVSWDVFYERQMNRIRQTVINSIED